MKDYEYKSLINEYDRFYRATRDQQQSYIERLLSYVNKLDKEELKDKDMMEENINHRVRLLKIASLCLGLHPNYLTKVQNEIILLMTPAESMSESTRELFQSVVAKVEKLSGETEN